MKILKLPLDPAYLVPTRRDCVCMLKFLSSLSTIVGKKKKVFEVLFWYLFIFAVKSLFQESHSSLYVKIRIEEMITIERSR